MHSRRRSPVGLSFLPSVGVLLATCCQLGAQTPPRVAAEAAFALPNSGEPVRSIRLLTIPGADSGGVEAALVTDRALYLAGKRWNREEKTVLWLWQVDDSGKKVWEKELVRQQRNQQLGIVGLLPGVRSRSDEPTDRGVRVVYHRGFETRLSSFSAVGDLVLDKKLEGRQDPQGLVIRDDDMFLFGRSSTARNEPSRAWIARATGQGDLVWKRSFCPKPPNSEELEDVPAGSFNMTLIFDAAVLRDGSVVFLGQTGNYSKFGQGPSSLWLLRIDGDGNQLAESYIEGGRRLLSGRDLIADCDGDAILTYTTSQVPPISSCPPDLGFDVRLARVNAGLETLWDERLPGEGMPTGATLTGPAPFLSVTARFRELQIRGTAENGDELWNAWVETPECFVTPLQVVRRGEDAILVCNYRGHRPEPRERLQQVLLIDLSLPRE